MPTYGVTADLHFDEYQSLSTLYESGLTTRLIDCIQCLHWIIDTCAERGCKGLLVLGDVFEARTEISVPVLDCVPRLFQQAEASGLELHVLVGNHDSHLRTPQFNSLQTLLGVARIYSEPSTFDAGGVVFGFLPWYDDPDKIAAAANAYAENADYLFGHMLVEGAVPKKAGVPPALLQSQEFEHVFLGDVHTPMHPVPGTKNVHYVGAPMPFDFRDADSPRGFSIINTDTGEHEFIENTESPRFYILDGTTGTDHLREKDFVRVKTADPEEALAVAEAAQEKTGWVESATVEVESEPPRLEVHAKDEQEEVLSRYVEHVSGKTDEALVKVGLEIIESVKAQE